MRPSIYLWAVFLLLCPLFALVGCKGKKEAPQVSSYLGDGEISDELAVTRVVLYQNGVGYFERRGTVEGDTLTLRIRPDQINDILKSLTIIDLGEGRPVSISLPVDRKAIDALSALPTQIREEGGLLSLLEAFRGARVVLRTRTGTVEGRIVGLENLPTTDANGNYLMNYRVTVKQQAGELQVVAVDDIVGLNIRDRTLEVGLDKSLDLSLNEGAWKPIELKVRMSSGGKREIMVSYIIAMPVWKPAYRLVLGDEDKGLFQGWSVVDNVSGSEWQQVRLSLVAGMPMSFRYDLYTPNFVTRPDLSARGVRTAIAPPVEQAAWGDSSKDRSLANELYDGETLRDGRMPGSGIGYGGAGRGGGGMAEGRVGTARAREDRAPRSTVTATGRSARDSDESGFAMDELMWDQPVLAEPEPAIMDYSVLQNTFEAHGEATQLGALFQYDIASRVTVPDRASALVNLVQANTKAGEVALFRTEIHGSYTGLNPFRAVQFENDSGFDLEPGPVTLYKSGTFVGEGYLPRTESGSVVHITFAMDARVTLKTAREESEEAAKILKISGGGLTSEIKRVTHLSYEIRNQHAEDIRAVIRRPVRPEWKLDPMPEGTLTAAGAYYIPVTVKAGATLEFKVRESTPIVRTLTLDSRHALDLLKVQITDDALDPALRAQLQEVVDKQGELQVVREQLVALVTQRDELAVEASRLADSLEDLKDIRDTGARRLREQLIARKTTVERDLNNLTTKMTELRVKESDLNLTLRALFRSISFEAPKAP